MNKPLVHIGILHKYKNILYLFIKLAVGTLDVARHDVPALFGFEIGGHETFPGCEVVASCQKVDGCYGSIGRIVNQSRHGDGCGSAVDT